MIIKKSVSDIRKNLASYLEKVSAGATLYVKDEKRGIEIAQITSVKTFNKNMYKDVLSKSAGVFDDTKHPEWSSLKNVIGWVNKNRISAERKF